MGLVCSSSWGLKVYRFEWKTSVMPPPLEVVDTTTALADETCGPLPELGPPPEVGF